MVKLILMSAAALMMLVGATVAKNKGKLPEGAVELTPDEVKAMYSGNSIDFKVAKYYFAPDGTTVGFNREASAFAEGTWSVSGNEFCIDSQWRDKEKDQPPFPFVRCVMLFKAGEAVWEKQTKGEERYNGDVGSTEAKKIKKGDIASKKVAAIKQKLGY